MYFTPIGEIRVYASIDPVPTTDVSTS